MHPLPQGSSGATQTSTEMLDETMTFILGNASGSQLIRGFGQQILASELAAFLSGSVPRPHPHAHRTGHCLEVTAGRG